MIVLPLIPLLEDRVIEPAVVILNIAEPLLPELSAADRV
ncbi:MAG: hypothetical protein HMLIMOIP_002190 [Candidatus Nitrosomirales archaeon]